MPRLVLDAAAARRALSLRDLTDPAAGPHAMQLLVEAVTRRLQATWSCAVRVHRASPVVTVADNYDRLHYPPGGAARDERYTRYLSETTLLRTHTSAMVPAALRGLVADAEQAPPDVLLACAGIVYRRDCIDRLHTGEPHQMDLWRLRRGPRLTTADLDRMIAEVVDALLPGRAWNTQPAVHPYTEQGRQIDVADEPGAPWIEIGECGLALPALLDESGLDTTIWSGLAMGVGLDRAVLLRKGMGDIRLLRAEDPRVATQMLDLEPYRPVSSQPATSRDLSIAVANDSSPEELGDRVRMALGDRAELVESIEVVSETAYELLPAVARTRLGMTPAQKNVLLRVVIRHAIRSMTHAEANEVRDDIYAVLHEGAVKHWASRTSR